jgi:recombination protein RecA
MDRHPDRAAVLASLRERWGAAAPRPATEVFGALAVAPRPTASPPANPPATGLTTRPLPTTAPDPATPPPGGRPTLLPALLPLPDIGTPNATLGAPRTRPAPATTDRTIPTGFPALDALLAAGGLPRAGTVALAGAGSSGATTLALRVLAEAQVGGALAAWVDLPRALDPVEAVARGVRLEWLAVLVPDDAAEALAMAGTLLQARAVDILVLDLGTAHGGRSAYEGRSARAERAATATPATPVVPARRGPRPPNLADQLARLVAFARRAGALLLVLEPADTPASLRAALDEGAGLRLELRRSGWVRLGREVVGQRTEVRVAKDHHGAPDRRTTLRILYAEGGPRDRCLARDELLVEEPVAGASVAEEPVAGAPPGILRPSAITSSTVTSAESPSAVPPRPQHEPHRSTDAPPPSLLATSRAPARAAAAARGPARRTADPRRAAVG